MAAGGADRAKIKAKLKEARRDGKAFKFKRASIPRMNLARGVEPYRDNAVFTQSPLTSADSPWQNSKTSALLHRETVLIAFQYPFALNLDDCKAKPDWTKARLKAIGELNGVAGNHARGYFEMAPGSIVLRLTTQLIADYDSYGFDSAGSFPEVVDGIIKGDYPGGEFFLGGKLVKEMESSEKESRRVGELKDKRVTVDRDPRHLLETVGLRAFPAKGK